MGDPLWNFLMSRDPDKVQAEWGPVRRDREVVEPRKPDPGLVGAWRRRALLAEIRNPAPAEVLGVAKRMRDENELLRRKLKESRQVVAGMRKAS